MNKVVELFGRPTNANLASWDRVLLEQFCPYTNRKCYKVRKSSPAISIGTCTVLYGRNPRPIIICPARLLERRQIFTDCLHLLTMHEPGNELHVVAEVTIPGGSVDYFLVSAKSGIVRDFVGVELQTLDTTGTVWPERQRLLTELGICQDDDLESSDKTFGMNWKMTAKTILVQMHHKIQTFEHLSKKLVLVVQNDLLNYMSKEFDFAHLNAPPILGDAMHIHSYQMNQRYLSYAIELESRLSTDSAGIAKCLGLQGEARVELSMIIEALQAKISTATRFAPMDTRIVRDLPPPASDTFA